jgi:hypothetical protein
MDAFKKAVVRLGVCLISVFALANSGCMLVAGAAAGGAAGAAGYAYFRDRKDSDTSVVVHSEPPLAPTASAGP